VPSRAIPRARPMVMRSARLLLAAPLVGLASTGWLARLPAQADPDAKVKGGGAFPAGWPVRTDKNRPTADVKFVRAGGGFHVTLGPGVVLAGATVTFLANGKEVYTARAAGLDTQGLVGYRVNHNLDVHLGALVVRKR